MLKIKPGLTFENKKTKKKRQWLHWKQSPTGGKGKAKQGGVFIFLFKFNRVGLSRDLKAV